MEKMMQNRYEFVWQLDYLFTRLHFHRSLPSSFSLLRSQTVGISQTLLSHSHTHSLSLPPSLNSIVLLGAVIYYLYETGGARFLYNWLISFSTYLERGDFSNSYFYFFIFLFFCFTAINCHSLCQWQFRSRNQFWLIRNLVFTSSYRLFLFIFHRLIFFILKL